MSHMHRALLDPDRETPQGAPREQRVRMRHIRCIDENNPPMALPTGNAYSLNAVQEIPDSDTEGPQVQDALLVH